MKNKDIFTEKLIKRFRYSSNYDCAITQNAGLFIGYVDNEVIDEYKTERDAEHGIKDFIKSTR